jgi:hypothetical protein
MPDAEKDATRGETSMGPQVETPDVERDRWALAELATPHGFVLGDVIARTIIASDWHQTRVTSPTEKGQADA